MPSWSDEVAAWRSTLDVWGRALLLVALAVVVGLVAVARADASTYPDDPAQGAPWVNECPALDAPCLAITERLEAVAALFFTVGVESPSGESYLAQIAANTTGSGAQEISGTVALAEGDAQRLDLIWIGVFLVGGISFGMALAAWIKREQSKWGMDA